MAAVSSKETVLSQQELAELNLFETSDLFDDTDKLVLRYATQMTTTPVEVDDVTFSQLKVKFNEKQLVELTAMIAWENYRARFNHAFGIESNRFTEGAACATQT